MKTLFISFISVIILAHSALAEIAPAAAEAETGPDTITVRIFAATPTGILPADSDFYRFGGGDVKTYGAYFKECSEAAGFATVASIAPDGSIRSSKTIRADGKQSAQVTENKMVIAFGTYGFNAPHYHITITRGHQVLKDRISIAVDGADHGYYTFGE